MRYDTKMIVKKTRAKYTKTRQLKITSPLITRILIGAIILLLISFFINIRLMVFLTIAIFFNAVLEKFRIQRGLPTDFELSTFSTVMITLAFGIKWGIFNAILTKIVTSLSTGNLLADHFFMIGTYILAAVIATLFPINNVFLLGIFIVVTNNIAMFLISKNILGLPVTENLSYTLTNFAFNFIVFSIFSQITYHVLT